MNSPDESRIPRPQPAPAAQETSRESYSPDGLNPDRETIQLGRLTVPRLFIGLWQLSSDGWGSTTVNRVRREMRRHVEAGYNAFDMADHYGTAEQIFGGFRSTLPDPKAVIGATKWCVFAPVDITRSVVQTAIDERKEKMAYDHVDLLQFHWQNYFDRQYMDALHYLQEIKEAGDITEVGLVNFDSARTDEICTQFPGLIVSNQVQFSLIDTRPLDGMGHVCNQHGIKLLTYGTLCGGFLSDKWLDAPQPDEYDGKLTPSQRKYLDVILGAWGTWPLFQILLRTLQDIGDRHGHRSISNIATRWILDHDFVGCVLVGSRLGLTEHIDDNDRAYGFRLTPEDNAAIEAVLTQSHGRELVRILGDCGAEYRRGSDHE